MKYFTSSYSSFNIPRQQLPISTTNNSLQSCISNSVVRSLAAELSSSRKQNYFPPTTTSTICAHVPEQDCILRCVYRFYFSTLPDTLQFLCVSIIRNPLVVCINSDAELYKFCYNSLSKQRTEVVWLITVPKTKRKPAFSTSHNSH